MITINYGIIETGQGVHPYHYITKGDTRVYKLSKDQSRLVYIGEMAEAIHYEKRTEMELSDYIKRCSVLDKWFDTFYCPHKLRKGR